MPERKRQWWQTIVAVGIVLILVLALVLTLVASLDGDDEYLPWWPRFSLAEVSETIRSYGPLGPLASIGLMVLHNFVPFPSEIITISNGMIFGPAWGIVITWVGAMLGAIIAFALTRGAARPWVERRLPRDRVEQMQLWTDRYGAGFLLFCRFMPIIAFNLVNYGAGLLRIGWWTFLWTTGVGILPLTILLVILGDQIHTLGWHVWLLFAAAGLALWAVTHRFKLRLQADDALEP